MSSHDEAAMLARELPVSISVVRDMLELGYSAEQIRAEVTLKVAGLPVPETWDRIIVGGEPWPPHQRPASPAEAAPPTNGRWVFWSPRGNGETLGSWLRSAWLDATAPATIATHPELECWASRDPR